MGDALITQMRKGALEYCVLALLETRPRYGFELVQDLAQINGLITSEGTIYPLLSRLRKDGVVETEWVESSNGPPRRYYKLTPSGIQGLGTFRDQWKLFRDGVDHVLGGTSNGRSAR